MLKSKKNIFKTAKFLGGLQKGLIYFLDLEEVYFIWQCIKNCYSDWAEIRIYIVGKIV